MGRGCRFREKRKLFISVIFIFFVGLSQSHGPGGCRRMLQRVLEEEEVEVRREASGGCNNSWHLTDYWLGGDTLP